MSVLTILKGLASPGSVGFLLVCTLVAVTLGFIWPKNRRLAGRWAIGVLAFYLVLSLPVVANGIADRLPRVTNAATAPDAAPANLDTLVVFDGDNRVGRARQAERVFAERRPPRVVVLGASWIVDRLVRDGMSRDRIQQIAGSENTRDQIQTLAQLLPNQTPPQVAVVVSRLQLPRVAALVQSAGLKVTLVPSPIDDEPPDSGIRQFVPSYIALRVSRDAFYEHVALAYYRWRGWIGR